jgi:hypothetical protein
MINIMKKSTKKMLFISSSNIFLFHCEGSIEGEDMNRLKGKQRKMI